MDEKAQASRWHWKIRLVGVKGARGCGKTTLLLQHLKNNHIDLAASGKALFASLDNVWFAKNSLLELADSFSKSGGKNKTGEQLKNIENAFVAADGIETGVGTKVPLWMFGFLY